jgi:hypothetical protein
MAMTDRRSMAKAAGAATIAAPYLRRVMNDEKVRDDLRQAGGALGHLVSELSSQDRMRKLVTDDQLRHDVDDMLAAMQDAGKRVAKPRRRMSFGRVLLWGTVIGGVIAVFTVRQSRERVFRAYDQLRGRTQHVAEDVSQKASDVMSEAA